MGAAQGMYDWQDRSQSTGGIAMVSGGFHVQAPVVAGTGTTICDLADRLRSNAIAWSQAESTAPSLFGVTDAANALNAVRSAWDAEFTVYVEVLTAWCTAMRTSSAAYQRSDTQASSRMVATSRVRAG